MTLKKPGKLFKKLTAEDLQHPRDQRSSWNEDKRRPKEEQGFSERRAAQGLATEYASAGEQTRRAYVNGILVKGPAEEVVPVARPILSQQPKRTPSLAVTTLPTTLSARCLLVFVPSLVQRQMPKSRRDINKEFDKRAPDIHNPLKTNNLGWAYADRPNPAEVLRDARIEAEVAQEIADQ